jgi:membrane-bound metal-dependent hydrolase YbcI (DUF457 family)
MHLECHAILGWLIANVGANDRRIRNYAAIGAVLPDIDALPYVISPLYYGLYHHTFGHNVFLWVLWTGFGWIRFRSWKAALLGFVAFGSHLLSDAFLSNWQLYLFWPFSRRGYLPAHSLELSSPVNTYLVYSIPLVLLIAALIWKRTPLEWINPKLDALFLSCFRRKTAQCFACGRAANLTCENCARPLCPTHVNVSFRWLLLCSDCRHARSGSTGTPQRVKGSDHQKSEARHQG